MDYEETVYNFQRAQSALEQSKAAMAKAERNLSYATITSPIDGVVTSRDVEEGQKMCIRDSYNPLRLFNKRVRLVPVPLR